VGTNGQWCGELGVNHCFVWAGEMTVQYSQIYYKTKPQKMAAKANRGDVASQNCREFFVVGACYLDIEDLIVCCCAAAVDTLFFP
jgi:hypothetical protein